MTAVWVWPHKHNTLRADYSLKYSQVLTQVSQLKDYNEPRMRISPCFCSFPEEKLSHVRKLDTLHCITHCKTDCVEVLLSQLCLEQQRTVLQREVTVWVKDDILCWNIRLNHFALPEGSVTTLLGKKQSNMFSGSEWINVWEIYNLKNVNILLGIVHRIGENVINENSWNMTTIGYHVIILITMGNQIIKIYRKHFFFLHNCLLVKTQLCQVVQWLPQK